MPIYEYKCIKCNAVFDCVILKIDEKFKPECEKCGSSDVKKLVSRVRYMGGPKQEGLASNAEQRMLKSFGGNVSGEIRNQVKELSNQAAKRGKKRFENMMDTGKSENMDY
jgi:putative FmdB family regulatory protein